MLPRGRSASLKRARVVLPAAAACRGAGELRLQAVKEWDMPGAEVLVLDLGLAGIGSNWERDELG